MIRVYQGNHDTAIVMVDHFTERLVGQEIKDLIEDLQDVLAGLAPKYDAARHA